MIAEIPGTNDQNRANAMYSLRDKARKEPPLCHKCGVKLAFDRAGETLPTCEQCARAGHAHINTSGGREKNAAIHKGPETVAIPRLFTLRIRQRHTRTALAKLSGSDAKTIKRIEEGNQRTLPKTAQKYADALGVGLEELQCTENLVKQP